MGIGNTASEAVAIAAGATFECRARNRIFLHGQSMDAHVYDINPTDQLLSRGAFIRFSKVNVKWP